MIFVPQFYMDTF